MLFSLVLLCCRHASHVLVGVYYQKANHQVDSVYDGPELNVLKTWSW